MTVVSVHIADVGLPKSLGLIRRPRSGSIPGLLHANAGVAAKFGTTPARPSPGRVGLIAFWQDEDALKQFEATHPLAAELGGGLVVHARPLRIHGAWPGIGDDVPKQRNVEHDGPVLVLTLAKTKFSRCIPFFRASQPAEKAVVEGAGQRVLECCPAPAVHLVGVTVGEQRRGDGLRLQRPSGRTPRGHRRRSRQAVPPPAGVHPPRHRRDPRLARRAQPDAGGRSPPLSSIRPGGDLRIGSRTRMPAEHGRSAQRNPSAAATFLPI